MKNLFKRFVHLLMGIALFLWSALATAESFIVRDIRLQGVERISPGTVLNYLPVKVGDEFDESRSADAVRALFKTGFFKDVRLEREGNTLVVVVSEREAISQITITGNKDIKTEDLLKALKEIGFAEGEVFDRSLLDKVEQELRRQYFSQGKYAVKIASKVKPLERNRVAVTIDISEGKAARIKQINIVGNKAFTDEELLKDFKLSTSTLLSFITKSDQYSKQKLGADLETLRSHYLDNGFINFNIDSTQVSITPDKSDIYITINITEGDRYTISGVKLAGELIVPQEVLFPMVTTSKGETFSRKDVTQTSTNISERLGDEGYAFANVNAIPDIDNQTKTVSLTYFVDPGKRVYVRRINFTGNTKTRDEVMRREMRQMEDAWIATGKVNRSKERLQRLGFFDEVNVETPAVPGTGDQVDVNYSVVERPSGNLMLGLGFSQTQGFIFNTSIVQDNFLGSGKRVKFAFNNSDVNRTYSLGYTDPYWTIHGVSLGYDLSYRETDAESANVTRFDSAEAKAGINLGIPVTEFQFVNLGAHYEHTDLDTGGFSSQQVQDFINEINEVNNCWAGSTSPPAGVPLCPRDAKFDVLRFNTGFAYDTRNKALLPDRGTLHRVRAEVTAPPGDLELYKISYDASWFYPLSEYLTLALQGEVGYGDSYGGTTKDLPFFESFYAGGPRSVRGYKENTLGLKDFNGRATGGRLKTIGNAEVLFPVPFATEIKSVRLSTFVDAGNVYGPGCRVWSTVQIDSTGAPVCLEEDNGSFDVGELRLSAGLSGIWLSPFGVLSVSVAYPFNHEPSCDNQPDPSKRNSVCDETQFFQFTFGTSF